MYKALRILLTAAILNSLSLMSFLAMGQTGDTKSTAKKIVIAHRGASGYLPEHSLQSKSLAFAMGADFIEQDLHMSRDDQLIVIHDRYLDRVSDVAEKYPNRARSDGRFYVIDFTLAEIKTLQLTERFKISNNKKVAVFKNRTPLWDKAYSFHTLAQEIELIQKLNREQHKNVGIYPEIKDPSFYRHEGKDISRVVLQVLKQYGYSRPTDNIYLQSFDPLELRRIHQQLFTQYQMKIPLVQLIAKTNWQLTSHYEDGRAVNYQYDWMLQAGGMQKIAQYAQGIGPWKNMLIAGNSRADNLNITPLFKRAHAVGLQVHPYTFRMDEGRVAKYASSFTDMLHIFYFKLGVDGVFTDFPDKAVELLNLDSAVESRKKAQVLDALRKL